MMFLLNNRGMKPPIIIWIIILIVMAIGIWIDRQNIKEFLIMFSIPFVVTIINIIYWNKHE